MGPPPASVSASSHWRNCGRSCVQPQRSSGHMLQGAGDPHTTRASCTAAHVWQHDPKTPPLIHARSACCSSCYRRLLRLHQDCTSNEAGDVGPGSTRVLSSFRMGSTQCMRMSLQKQDIAAVP